MSVLPEKTMKFKRLHLVSYAISASENFPIYCYYYCYCNYYVVYVVFRDLLCFAGIQILNLSCNPLLPNWEVIASIAVQLPLLNSLELR